nr:hypothetical protein [Tanacetum cinerariifolium]
MVMRKEMQMSILKKLILVMLLKEMIVLLMEKFLLLLKNNPFHLLHHLLHHYNHLKISLQHHRCNKHHHNHLRRVEHLEYDKVAQALEITKLKRRVKKLKKRNKVRVLKLRRLQKIGTSQRDDAVVLKDDKEENKEVADAVKDAEEAKDETEPSEVQKVVNVVTIAKLITKVVTATSETVTASSTIITTAEAHVPAATTAILIAAPARDEAIDHVKRKDKEDLAVKRYQAMKRKPQTEAQARKNMMMYLKNIVGFKLNYFKGMSYDDIRLIFEVKFNSNVDFILKTKEKLEEEENRSLQMINETPAEKASKRRKLNEEELELIKKEKEGLDSKLTGFQTASKYLDSLLESQRLDKNREGLGYNVVPPPPAQIYSPPKKDISWTGLPEFADDTVTDYSRHAPTVESSSDDAQNRNLSVTTIEASPNTISPKPFITFVKANDSLTKSKTDKVETSKKPTVKYAKLYRKPSKGFKVCNGLGSQEGLVSNVKGNSRAKLEDAVRTKRSRGVVDYIHQVKKTVLTKKLEDSEAEHQVKGRIDGIKEHLIQET